MGRSVTVNKREQTVSLSLLYLSAEKQQRLDKLRSETCAGNALIQNRQMNSLRRIDREDERIAVCCA